MSGQSTVCTGEGGEQSILRELYLRVMSILRELYLGVMSIRELYLGVMSIPGRAVNTKRVISESIMSILRDYYVNAGWSVTLNTLC